MTHNLDHISEYFGSKANLARALKVAPQNLNNWRTRGVPAWALIQIELLTYGKFKASDLHSQK